MGMASMTGMVGVRNATDLEYFDLTAGYEAGVWNVYC